MSLSAASNQPPADLAALAENFQAALHFRTLTNEDFDQLPLTEFLNTEQRTAIAAQKVSLKEISFLSRRVNHPLGMPSLIYSHDFPHNLVKIPTVALRARFNEEITDEQFTTLCLVYEAADQLIFNPNYIVWQTNHLGITEPKIFSPTRKIPKFDQAPTKPIIAENLRKYQDADDEVVSSPRLNFLRMDHMFHSKYREEAQAVLQKFFGMSDYEFLCFRLRMEQTHPSEHYFYLFLIPPGPTVRWSPMYARICEVLGERLPIEIYPAPTLKKGQSFEPTKYFVVPSFSMLQTFSAIRYGKHASLRVGLLGEITEKTIGVFRKAYQTVFNIGMEGAVLPNEADKILTGGQIAFTWHDDYHAQRYSMILNNEKTALLHLVNRVIENALQFVPSDPSLEKIKWALTDAELHDSVLRGHKFGQIFQKLGIWNEDSKRLVITDMVYRKNVWKGFGLSRDDLHPPEQKIYDELMVSFIKFAKVKEYQFADPITKEQYEKIKMLDPKRRVITM